MRGDIGRRMAERIKDRHDLTDPVRWRRWPDGQRTYGTGEQARREMGVTVDLSAAEREAEVDLGMEEPSLEFGGVHREGSAEWERRQEEREAGR